MNSKIMIFSLFFSLSSAAFEDVDMASDAEVARVEVTEVSTVRIHPHAFFSSTAIGMGACQENEITGSKFSNPLALSKVAVAGVAVDAALDTILATVDKVDQVYDKVVNLGKKIWTLYDAGKPVVNLTTDVATALPVQTRCWTDLEGWQSPVAKTMEVKFYNQFGFQILKFQYRIVLLFGGSKDGKGKYIGYAAVQPSNLSVAMLHNFSAKASATSIYNMGTKADPVAGMTLDLEFTIKKSSGFRQIYHSYELNGNGVIRQIREVKDQ